MDIKHKFVLKI